MQPPLRRTRTHSSYEGDLLTEADRKAEVLDARNWRHDGILGRPEVSTHWKDKDFARNSRFPGRSDHQHAAVSSEGVSESYDVCGVGCYVGRANPRFSDSRPSVLNYDAYREENIT
jgi:hypothetical protein